MIRRIIVLLGVLMALRGTVMGDVISWNLPFDYESSRTLEVGNTYRIYDDGGPNTQYRNNAHGSLLLIAPEGYVLHFEGSYAIQDSVDALKLYDTIGSLNLFGIYFGRGNIDIISTSNRVKVELISNEIIMWDGFELTVTLMEIDPGNYHTEGCFNYTYLLSPDVVCATGNFTNPSIDEGYVYGRHTIITDTTGYDPYTADSAYKLKMVPKGYAASVRLGNDGCGAQAERITYAYTVDTSQYDMLIMRYAAVLEDPGHESSQQPKMTFRFVDENGNDINSNCYSARFTASAELGWHPFTHGLNQGWYSDWTPVGVDLSPLHGQTIYIELTTYDCAEMGHFGYSYFVFSCTRKYISSSSCGNNIDNTFTAPEGYTYTWHKDGNLLSHEQSLHVTTVGTYYCTLHSIGASSTSCDVIIAAEAGGRFPYAQYTYRYTGSMGTCDGHVAFTNHSVICRDSAHTIMSSEPCETFLWNFDDGTTSREVNPRHFFAPGSYNVTLKALLADGECADSIVQTIVVTAPIHEELWIENCEGIEYRLFDTVLNSAGTYVRDSTCIHRIVHLEYVTTKHTQVRDTIVENELPYQYRDCIFEGAVTDSLFLLTAEGGCDSVVHYSLVVHENRYEERDTIVCEELLPFEWGETIFDSAMTVTDTLTDKYGADSIVQKTLKTWSSYEDTLEVMLDEGQSFSIGDQTFDQGGSYVVRLSSAEGCDSIIHLKLIIIRQSLYAPNVFSPQIEGDERFFLTGENLMEGNVWVYERRGLLVAEFDLIEGYWDGKKDGKDVPQGSYVWLCRYRSKIAPEKWYVEKGTVTLIR